jgi:hypothetical protein
MRNSKLIALVAATACAALGIGYLSGRHAAPNPMAASSISALALPAGPSLPSASTKKATNSRRVVASPTTHVPLPPKGTPLKEIMPELAERANAGDVDAAARIAHDLQRCLYMSRMKQIVPTIAAYTLNEDDSKLSAEELEERAARLDLVHKQIDKIRANETMCQDVGYDEYASIFPMQMRAAELGDVAAANCYLGQGVGAPGLFDHPEWLTQFKNNALNVAQNAVEQGDWVAVALLDQAYRPFNPGVLLQQLVTPDPAMVYRYLRLQRLGASGDFATRLDKEIAEKTAELTPEQIADGDVWAQDTYGHYFNGSSSDDLSNGFKICNAADD